MERAHPFAIGGLADPHNCIGMLGETILLQTRGDVIYDSVYVFHDDKESLFVNGEAT